MNQLQLQQLIRSRIPISEHMDFKVCELTDHVITVSGGGNENINVHGTAFAGSLYAICALAVWGLVTSRLPPRATLVMANGEIHYKKSVVGDIVAHCELGPDVMDEFLQKLKTDGRTRLEAEVNVHSLNEPAAVFKGIVYSRIPQNQ